MRKFLLMAAAAAVVSSPAMARDGQGYIGVEGGYILKADTKFDAEVAGTTARRYDDAVEVDYRRGFDVDAIAGYDFGMIRTEAELGYKRLKIDNLTFSDALRNDIGAGLLIADYNDNVSVLSGMANVLVDIGNDAGVSAFVGGGAGLARVKAFDERDSALAWQLLAGVRAAVSDNVDFGVKYRFFNTGRLDFSQDPNLGFSSEGKLRSHSVLASLIYNFGGRAAVIPAAVPVTAPPPPPPVRMQTCPDGSVIPTTSYCPPRPTPPPPPPRRGERG